MVFPRMLAKSIDRLLDKSRLRARFIAQAGKLDEDREEVCLLTSVRNRIHRGFVVIKTVQIGREATEQLDRKSTRLNSSHRSLSRMPSSA